MKQRNIILATTSGTVLEWAEFTFFAYMAEQLAVLFFAPQELMAAKLKTYAIFATSYLMRPLGALIFGYIGDKYGRKPAITRALVLMAFATCAIGLLPTYSSIGLYAPLMLMIFRMIQGVAVAGEFNGAAVLLTEHGKHAPYLSGAWTATAAALGMAIGSLVATILQNDNMPVWAWRVPFLLSAVIALLAAYLRNNMHETTVFIAAKDANQLFSNPLQAAWQYNKAGLLCTAGFAIFISVFVYTGNLYYKSMAINIGKIAPQIAAQIITGGILLAAILMPITAYIADRTNGYRICLVGLIAAIVGSPIMMWCAQSGEIGFTILGQIIYAIIDALVSATLFTLLLQQFKTGNKYSGSSVAWSVTTAIFGGSTLMINELLVNHYKFLMGPGIYITISALVCLIIVVTTNKK